LENSYLKSIPCDRSSVNSDITLSAFRSLAYERLYLSKSAEEIPPPEATAELFLLNSYLSTHTSSTLILGDLGLEGSESNPLDIFVVLRSKKTTTADRPRDACAFRSTDRGMATFHTSLLMLLKKIEDGHQTLPNMLEIIWGITHFPPALIAFRQLFEDGIQPFPYAVFASCFREACLRMIPPWIASTPESVFEGSRQIFAWFYSLQPKTLSDSGVAYRLVHAVEISEVASEHADDIHGAFVNNDVVEIQDPSYDTSKGESSAQPMTKKFLVSKENRDQVMPRLLALALNGSYDTPYNYYLEFPASVQNYLEHRRDPILHPSDFYNLLQATNHDDAFKMVGPLQLSSSRTPLITLNKDGYVSIYDLKDVACGEGYPYIRNLITGEEKLACSDPGQYLLQKLTPIISNRRKNWSWDVDAWNNRGQVGSAVAAEEAIVICVDRSGSMGNVMGSDWMERGTGANSTELSRLSEVKEVFQNLVARIAAYKLPTQLGLVTFSDQSSVRINQALTPVLYDFKDQLMGIYPSGSTAMWDALIKAKEMLVALKAKNPAVRCRIIILTDGENNGSKYLPAFVCTSLYDADIVLDSIVIGTNSTCDLFKISMHTGGYAFCPKTRSALFQIFLLETLIDIKVRPDIVKVPIAYFPLSPPKRADMSTPFDIPPCRPHQNLYDTFIALRDASCYLAVMANRSSRTTSSASSIFSGISLGGNTVFSGISSAPGAGGSGRVFLNEARAIIDNPHDYMDVYVSESNMGFWKVVMKGPPASPYEDGTFVLFVEIGDQFPRKAPTVRFITPILHPNITKVSVINRCHAFAISNAQKSTGEYAIQYLTVNGPAAYAFTKSSSKFGEF
jgi:Ubiquitin-conjugating enzyme/von Willebrand factor type A domain